MSIETLGRYRAAAEDPRCFGKVEQHLIKILVIAVCAVTGAHAASACCPSAIASCSTGMTRNSTAPGTWLGTRSIA